MIEKYQTSSCEEFAAQKKKPPSGSEAETKQKATALLKKDPHMRRYFLDKGAGPIANKMFECGLIP